MYSPKHFFECWKSEETLKDETICVNCMDFFISLRLKFISFKSDFGSGGMLQKEMPWNL